jgi:hypothetical protein
MHPDESRLMRPPGRIAWPPLVIQGLKLSA